MGQHDTSQDVQNRFTAYLLVALRRKKRDYVKKRSQINTYELLTDFQDTQYPDERDYNRSAEDPSMFLTEDVALMEALSHLTAKDRYIFFERVLKGVDYDTLASKLNMRRGSVSTAYHRVIQKLKKALKEEHQ